MCSVVGEALHAGLIIKDKLVRGNRVRVLREAVQ